MQVLVELVLGREGGAVDAGQHGPPHVAAPVGAGDAEELEGLDLAGAGEVWAAAQVDEVALLVEADGVVFDGLEQLDLVDLLCLAHAADGLVSGQLDPLERQVLGDDRAHLVLDARQVIGADGLGQLEVVVEAVVDGRADGEPGAWEQPGDGVRHDV